MLVQSCTIDVTEDQYSAERNFLREYFEPYDYHNDANIDVKWKNMHDDPGAVGASLIHRAAKGEGRRVFLSGQGADEILSDYSKSPKVSSLNGFFPVELIQWPNFQGGCQRAYLSKEEFVAGAHGIETRYPFLDRELVQEFLWLSPDLKNQTYKAPLHTYLESRAYPFYNNAK